MLDDLIIWKEGEKEVLLDAKDTYTKKKKSKYLQKVEKSNVERKKFEKRLFSYKKDLGSIIESLEQYKRHIHNMDYEKYYNRLCGIISKIKKRENNIDGNIKISIIAFRKRQNEILSTRERLFPSEKEYIDKYRDLVNTLLH